jgi:amino acid adenylation domain-containing protein
MQPIRTGTEDELPSLVCDPENRFAPFPLTDSQQALWIGRGDSIELGSVGCHGYFEWEVPDLDIERFRRAWHVLVERHDSLRTVILPSGMQQVLSDPPEYAIDVLDLRDTAPEITQRQLLALRDELSHQTLPDCHWPLFDIRLSRLAPQAEGENRVRVHLSLDMTVVDAWSYFQVLLPDLERSYRRPGEDITPLRLTFRDYVLTLDRHLAETEIYHRAERYWRDRIADLPPAPQLPSRPAWQETLPPRFGRCEHRLAATAWSKLKDSAAQFGVTPSCALAAAFAEVLRTWSGQDRFTINFPLFDRLPLHPEIDQIMGDTTASLLLAAEPCEGAFAQRAQALQDQLHADFAHRHYSGVRVIRDLARLRGRTAEAAMPVVMTSLLGLPPRSCAAAIGDSVYSISQTPQVSIDFQVFEFDGELQLNWDYLPCLFPDGMIADMFDAYVRILDQLASETRGWLTDRFEMLSAEFAAQRARINDTARPVRDLRLPDLLTEHVRERPDAPALVAPDRTLSYAEFWAASGRLAWQLREAGVGPGDLVGVVMRKGWEQYVAVYAVLLAGAAYLPVDADLPAARRRLLLERGSVRVAVTQPETSTLPDWPTAIRQVVVGPSVLDGPVADAGESVPPRAGSPDDLAYVLFTSGSTGEPKGVMVSHRSVVNHVDDVNRRLQADPGTRALATAALHFDMSVYDMFGVPAAGGTVILPPPDTTADPGAWLAAAKAGQVTFWAAVPALMDMAVTAAEQRQPDCLGSLRAVVLAGDWIPLDLPDRVRAVAPRADVISSGGPTETVNWSIWNRIEAVDPRWTSIPYGMPMDNHRYLILDDRLSECPAWVPGQMYDVSDVGLAMGYWRDSERTAAAFLTLADGKRAYATGDRGRYLPDGQIEILGRTDFQIKIRGHRIEPGEVEAALRTHPSVRDAVVVAVGDHAQKRLVAHVTGTGELPEGEALQEHVAGLLPAPMVPAQIVWHEQLPLSTNAKIDRKALTDWRAAEPTAVPVESDDALDQLISSVWAETLGVSRIGPGDRFIDLGGNSMTAMLVAGHLSDLLEIDVPMRVMFDKATVSGVAAALRDDPEYGHAVVATAERLAEAVS